MTSIYDDASKGTLETLCHHVFGADCDMRWVNAHFPFTYPSFELEIFHKDKWMEVLGCGVIEQDLLKMAGIVDKVGWAFGLGLERLAMVRLHVCNEHFTQ